MVQFDERYPRYGFARHKGYGTASHWRALQSEGPCEIHRFSFEPIRLIFGREAPE
jgi:ribonuclease HII